jgi:hypothetical protein
MVLVAVAAIGLWYVKSRERWTEYRRIAGLYTFKVHRALTNEAWHEEATRRVRLDLEKWR